MDDDGADADMMALMGITAFGKSKGKGALDMSRFDKTKRADAARASVPRVRPTVDDDDDDDPGPRLQSFPPVPTPVASTSRAPTAMAPARKPEEFVEPEFEPSEDEADDEDDDAPPEFPVTHELVLKQHTKVVSAIAMEPSGARFVSGGHDYELKLWDFGGMDERCHPFKVWEPAGSYYVHDIKYANEGGDFLCISGTAQAKLYDRQGEEKATFIKGDPYIRDMHHTAGHVGELTSCAWHPWESQYFITSSADSTIRVWEVENKRKQKTVIVIKSKERGARTKVTACAYSIDAALISGACLDGALHMYSTTSNYVRPTMSIEGAHTKGTETGSVVFSIDGRTVLTRGGPGDDCVKTWDLRAFKKPLSTRAGLTTLYPGTNAIFSPDGQHVVTGSGAAAKGAHGAVVIMSKEGLQVQKEADMETTVVRVLWHSKINQIIAGLASGQMSVLYSPRTSINGAKLVSAKGRKKATVEDAMTALLETPVIIPDEVLTYRDGREPRDEDREVTAASLGLGFGAKRKRERTGQDPRRLRRPEMPVSGPGKGGRVGASATQHVVQNLVRDTTRDEDPREALLKYADTEKNPMWTKAWTVTQPKPVFAAPEEEREEE